MPGIDNHSVASIILEGVSGGRIHTLGEIQRVDYSGSGEHFATFSPIGVFIQEADAQVVMHWIQPESVRMTPIRFSSDGSVLCTGMADDSVMARDDSTVMGFTSWQAVGRDDSGRIVGGA